MSEWLFSHMGLLVGLCIIIWQSIHKLFQKDTVFDFQFSFERMSQTARQTAYPTFATVMQISTSPGKFASGIDPYSVRRTNDS